MATVPQPPTPGKPSAYRALLYDEPGTLGKINGKIYFFGDDGRIIDFEVDMAPFTCVLGAVSIAETQAIVDRMNGGAVGICLSRGQEEQ